jgi:hypothetical protein
MFLGELGLRKEEEWNENENEEEPLLWHAN